MVVVKMRWVCFLTQVSSLSQPLFSTRTRFHFSLTKTAGTIILPPFSVRNQIAAERVHAKAIKDGSLRDSKLASYLLGLYLKSQDFDDARKLFDEIPDRDVRTWTILLSGFSRIGLSGSVLELFRDMQMEGVRPNKYTLSSVLKSCSNFREIKLGQEIHGWVVRNGTNVDVVLENSVLDLYAKCDALDYAKRLFELMEKRDTVSCNIMLAAYLQFGEVDNSLELFKSTVFQDVVSWNTMIDGLIRNGFERIAMELLYQMADNGSTFNEVTFSVSLVLASSLSFLELGKQIHARILRIGICMDAHLRNSLVNMYCKCGHMGKASLILKKIPLNVVRTENAKMAEAILWSSMVSGYVQNDDYIAAFRIFSYMVREQLEMDSYTLTSIISACADSRMLVFGLQVHAYIQKINQKVDAHLGSSLIEMYAKHGNIKDAMFVFEQTDETNVVLWTSMIYGCALHGEGVEATRLFEQMIEIGITPNEITFVAILTACSHGGLLEEGQKYFRLMREVYNINPGVEHWTCMVDIYGRAGLLNEAKEFISENNISHISAVWKSLLSFCRLHKKIELGKGATGQLLNLEPFGVGPYLLSSNICATEHRWEEVANARDLMRKIGIRKHPGQSWIETKNLDCTFVIGGVS